MIEATNLSKAYGPIEALREVSFHIAQGEIVGLLGPNMCPRMTTSTAKPAANIISMAIGRYSLINILFWCFHGMR